MEKHQLALGPGIWEISCPRPKTNFGIIVVSDDACCTLVAKNVQSRKREREEEREESSTNKSPSVEVRPPEHKRQRIERKLHPCDISEEFKKLALERTNQESMAELSLRQYATEYLTAVFWDRNVLIGFENRVAEYPYSVCLLLLNRLHPQLDEHFFRHYPVEHVRYLVIATWNYNGECTFPNSLDNLRSDESRVGMYMFACHFSLIKHTLQTFHGLKQRLSSLKDEFQHSKYNDSIPCWPPIDISEADFLNEEM